MKKQTKTNHTHLKDSGHTSGKHSALSGASAGRPDTNIQEGRICPITKDGKPACNIREEFFKTLNGCKDMVYREGYNKCLAEVEKIIWKYPNEFITEAETKDEAESIKSEIIQKLKEMKK